MHKNHILVFYSIMTKHPSLELGKKLKYLRFQVNANQSEIAKKLKISQQAYSYLENGKTHFTETIIEKICSIFNLNFQEFVSINSQTYESKSSKNLIDTDLDIFTARVMILNLKKQLIEKDLKIIELELMLKTKQKKQNLSPAKPIYVLI